MHRGQGPLRLVPAPVTGRLARKHLAASSRAHRRGTAARRTSAGAAACSLSSTLRLTACNASAAMVNVVLSYANAPAQSPHHAHESAGRLETVATEAERRARSNVNDHVNIVYSNARYTYSSRQREF